MNLVLAINYGARDEITRAIQKMLEEQSRAQRENSAAHGIEAEDLSRFFDIPLLPDADLIIRTGGEKRLSNFLLWQAAYAEFDFTDTLWPDYTDEDFYRAIADFQKRHRRFGAAN